MQVVIGFSQAALQEANVLLEIPPHRGAGEEQAIALGGEHLDQLPAPGQEGIERL